MKETSRWFSHNVQRETQLVRWGTFGTPVLLFPTAGGDAEEIERFLLIDALAPLLEAGRIKVYSVDSIAGAAWISKRHPPAYCSKLQTLFARRLPPDTLDLVPHIDLARHEQEPDAVGPRLRQFVGRRG